MRNLIREKRRVSFDKKRITPDIIRKLVTIIENEIKRLTKKESETFFVMYSLDATDNSSYESQSPEIFDEKKFMELKVIRKVAIRFNTIDNSKNIEIQIVHSLKNDKSENFILVSGDDSHWVNGVENDFNEVLFSAEPQPKYVNAIGYYLFFSWLFFIIYFFNAFFSQIERIINGWLKIFVILGVPILSIFLSFYLFEHINSLWPSIELQTGPQHQQIPDKNRKRTYLLLSLVVIPILIEIIIDLVKSKI